MSFEAINTVREAEERAKQIKLEATQAAAEAVEAAERDGKEAVEAALSKAREELKSLRSKTDEKATQDAEALAAATKNQFVLSVTCRSGSPVSRKAKLLG